MSSVALIKERLQPDVIAHNQEMLLHRISQGESVVVSVSAGPTLEEIRNLIAERKPVWFLIRQTTESILHAIDDSYKGGRIFCRQSSQSSVSQENLKIHLRFSMTVVEQAREMKPLNLKIGGAKFSPNYHLQGFFFEFLEEFEYDPERIGIKGALRLSQKNPNFFETRR